jgi:hypothetical protein
MIRFLGILRRICFGELYHDFYFPADFNIVSPVLASVIAVVVIALGAQITSIAETDTDSYAKFAALGIATGGLTIFTLPVL